MSTSISMYQKKQKSDSVIKTLVTKKLELLKSLLVESQHFVAVEQDSEQIYRLKKRAIVFTDLKKTDDRIAQREKTIGISAHAQEEEIFKKIKYLIQSIQNNNTVSLNRLALENQKLKHEKSQLEKSNKLSGYIFQQKSNVPFKPIINR